MKVVWLPYELRPFPNPTLRPEDDYLQRAWRTSVYPLANRLHVAIALPDVSPQPYTRKAFEGLEFAREHGLADAYNSAVMQAFFQFSRNIGDPDVRCDIAAGVGLDATKFGRALEAGTYSERVLELLQEAYGTEEISGVPHFVVGKRPLRGLQSRQALEQAIAEELESQEATGAQG